MLCCVLGHDTLLTESTGIPRKKWPCPNMTEKIADLDVKPQHK